MLTNNKDFKAFEGSYKSEEKEILILIGSVSGGAGKFRDSWDASQSFLAYVDLEINELKEGEGCVDWLISEEESKEHGTMWPFYFQDDTIYRLKVRELKDENVPEGGLSYFYNRFMVVEVLEENIQNNELQAILTEYKKPVEIVDEKLGKFDLNKDYAMFEGSIKWLGEEVSVLLEVDVDDKETWTEVMDILRMLHEQQEQKDIEFRNFAGEKLTELANKWLEDENQEITKNDFIKRISLSELSISFDGGSFTAYYDDDDMFYGHVVSVYGNINDGLKSATIEG